ncbi:MAG: FtsX-like permease family protein [Armatimonadetes bacterium]|nr:FtsX-like permease family protein [Armatimonadota bacterium]
MADDSDSTGSGIDEPEDAGQPAEGEAANASGTPVRHGRVEALSEEEIRARLVSTDSGATLDHDEVVQGMARELGAQRQVIDLLSDQREPEGVNIAKVLDSSAVDLEFIMGVAVTQETATIIGGKADPAQRRAIRDQISLPFNTAFKMCLRSIWIRIGRVAITGSGIFLGIAFYASVSLTAAIMRAVAGAEGVEQETARQTWLIVMALMVSVVGISNSMLMAVAERFREIGTMKCLGALDSFIVKLFVIESGLLGLLAGLFGAVLGMGLTYVIKAMKLVFSFGDVSGDMLRIMLYSVVLGTVLSVLAAILPANQAAKMPAAAALRTDV